MKIWEYDKEPAQIFSPGARDIVQSQGASEGEKFVANATQSETKFSFIL